MTKAAYKISVLTLFPDMFPGPLGHSITGRALKNGLWEMDAVDIRSFGLGKHKNVDDTPYGGGAGMVMRCDVVADAVREAKKGNPDAKVVFLTPSGKPFKQEDSRRLSQDSGVILLCGHYEGIDQRALDAVVDEEISIGDYVLTGGELGAYVVSDAIIRNLNETLGNETTLHEESFDLTDEHGNQLIEYPHYTRPVEWEGRTVPEVLQSGHHANIQKWRLDEAKEKTRKIRPDLIQS